MSFHKYLYLSLILISTISADVKSTTDTIDFDVNSDGQVEARLSGGQFGIGTTSPSENLHVVGNAIISQQLTIGTVNASQSNLHTSGTISHSFQTLSSSGTIPASHSIYFIDTSSSNLLLDLPAASSYDGRLITLKSISNTRKALIKGGGNYIDGEASITLNNDSSTMAYAKLISSGGNWHILTEAGLTSNSDPASDNLIAYYPLDEGSGNVIYDQQNSYDGSRQGFETSGNGWVDGIVGTALDFDGLNDYVLLPGSIMNDSAGSISAWVKTTASVESGIRQIVYASSGNGNGLGAENELHVHMASDAGEPQLFIEASATGPDVHTNAIGSLNDGLWHHVVATWDGNVAKIYQDGQVRHQESYTAVGYTCTLATIIGSHAQRNSEPERAWKGVIDEVRLYNRPLNHEEVTQLYQFITFEEPVLQYDFEEGSGDTTRTEESSSSYLGSKINFETSGNGWVSGKFGDHALEFDGLDDMVDIQPKGLLSADNVSISIWFKTTFNDTGFMLYFSNDSNPGGENGFGDGDEIHIGIQSPGQIRVFGHGVSNDLSLTSAGTYNDDIWHHAAVSISGTNGKLVVDNTDSVTDSWDIAGGAGVYSSTNLRIGGPGTTNPQRTWSGALDELKIWNRAISDSEIENLYLLGQ